MKSFFKIMMLALLVLPFQACSDDDDAAFTPTQMAVTPNNISGVWKLDSWSGSDQYTPVVYLELIRRDRKYNLYEHYGSMYPSLRTGAFELVDDEDKGVLLTGEYDYASGNWNNSYIVKLYANKMILTVDGDAGDVQIFVRVDEVPAHIKETALSPIAPAE